MDLSTKVQKSSSQNMKILKLCNWTIVDFIRKLKGQNSPKLILVRILCCLLKFFQFSPKRLAWFIPLESKSAFHQSLDPLHSFFKPILFLPLTPERPQLLRIATVIDFCCFPIWSFTLTLGFITTVNVPILNILLVKAFAIELPPVCVFNRRSV